MEQTIQAIIISFREGLEAFLIITILLEFLNKTNNTRLKPVVWHGAITGIAVSFVFGIGLFWIASYIGAVDATAKLWESVMSLAAVGLIGTFIVGIIKHGRHIATHIKNKAALNISKKGMFLLALFLVAREGVEIAIFSFAGKYTLFPILVGVALSLFVVILIHFAIINIRLQTIFIITLVYLILQSGFLFGYGIHEGLSALKSLQLLAENNIFLTKAFNLSDTVLSHKDGIIGMPLYILFGWYSKPEWIQLFAQYGFTAAFFAFWYKQSAPKKTHA